MALSLNTTNKLQLLKTMDRCIHAGCLRCGQCGGNLENGAFTMDNDGGIFCLEDYQRFVWVAGEVA